MTALFTKPKSSERNRLFCSAVIVAAGSGERMRGINKLFAKLDGVPVLLRSILAFEKSGCIDEIIVSARGEEMAAICELAAKNGVKKLSKVIEGGEKRSDSVYKGLMEVSEKSVLTAIHDGARPLVTERVIESAVLAAARSEAAAPAVRVKDTIKTVSSGKVKDTPDRSLLYAVQTPQVFKTDVIKAALTAAIKSGAELTDDCMALERLGIPVVITEGDYNNIKITTPEDLAVAEAVLRGREARE